MQKQSQFVFNDSFRLEAFFASFLLSLSPPLSFILSPYLPLSLSHTFTLSLPLTHTHVHSFSYSPPLYFFPSLLHTHTLSHHSPDILLIHIFCFDHHKIVTFGRRHLVLFFVTILFVFFVSLFFSNHSAIIIFSSFVDCFVVSEDAKRSMVRPSLNKLTQKLFFFTKTVK